MGEWIGVAIALLSSCLGGTAAAITRYLTGGADPIALAVLRWGIGFVCLLPAALLLKARWPARRDLPAVAALGVCFFGLFFIFYNIAISFTTAARASLALATLPLSTMVVAALLGVEKLTFRKTLGVCIAVFGVAAALAAGLSAAPQGAWRGELIMLAAVFCNAFYNVLSRPLMRRSSALGFLTVGMGAGAAVLIAVGLFTGSIVALKSFSTPQWIAGIYLGVGGGAAAFILWVLALERATPTRVANTMTVNPIAAALLAKQLVGEPITPNLVLGLIAVFAGIWIATQENKNADQKRVR
ncbi:MAG TPA: DMT family transporter [Bradyrhizobium sp.]|nr:DMT family transporter [Bradyrhizobium sp.]